MSKEPYIPVVNRRESCKLAFSDICYVYRTNRKVRFETEYGEKYMYTKMDDVEKSLGPEFFRCMSGCIVNMSRIKDMRDRIVFFDDGKTIKLGRESFVKLHQKYNAYLHGLLREREENGDAD